MTSPRHAHPRRARSLNLTRGRRAIQGLALTGLVAASLTATGSAAEAQPEQVLQSIRVAVGPDGSITGVESQAVRRSGDDDPRSTVRQLAPTEASSKLPVRVLTSYRLGERSGTDLSEIEGKAGRVVIQVTVQNTTVRPQELTYQTSDGDSATTTALVGTPLTVVGSAKLGKGELSRIVTNNDADPDAVTSGVVSRGDDGSGRVQWAALLAPPRLAPSATFTLVEETTDFQVPTFDFSVQPGIVTDASLTNLIDSAFSDDGDSTLQLESRTISIIGQVNTVLADAGSVLTDIQTTLDDSAGRLGERTVGELQQGRDRVDSGLTSTISQLESLDSQIESELDGTSSQTLGALNGTLDDVRALLGDPKSEREPQLRFGGGCDDAIPAQESGLEPSEVPTSVLYRMRLVGAQLQALTKASKACTERIQEGLRETVGQKGRCATPAAATTAICTLESTIGQLTAKSQEISLFGASLKELADPHDSIAALRQRLTDATAALGGLQTDTDEIREQGLLAGDLTEVASGVKGQLDEVQTVLAQLSLDDITAGYDQIRGIADTQLALIGDEDNPDSIIGGVSSVTDKLLTTCGLVGPQLNGVDLDDLTGALLQAILGTQEACTDVDDLVEELQDQVAGLGQAWTDVQGLTDLSDGSHSPVRDAVESFDDKLGDLSDDVLEARTKLDSLITKGEDSGEFEETLDGLLDGLDGLYDAGLPGSGTPCAPVTQPRSGAKTPARPLVNQLLDSFETVSCNSDVLQDQIDTRMATFTAVVDDAQNDVGVSRDDTDAARQAAENEVATMTGRLSRRIQAAGTDVTTRVEGKVTKSRGQLTRSERNAKALLDRLTSQASARLSQQVSASNTDLAATNEQLQSDLASVLLDLGTRGTDGSGLLGTLASSARRTSLSNADLAGAGQQASAFRSIRGQVLSDIRLQQVQTDRSLELTSQFPSLDLDVAPGSRVLTVFSFHIGG